MVALDYDWSGSELPKDVARIDFDLRQLSHIPALVESLGDVLVLVNNAGRLYCPSPDALATEGSLGFTAEMSMDILTTNLRAPVALIEAVAPQMVARGKASGGVGGRIVNVGSVSAFTGHPDIWYGASKAALLNITKTFAGLLGKSGVLVNAVAPGPTLTDMYESLPQHRKDMVMALSYIGRPAQPAEVAEVILWLGTTSPEYTSGTTVDVNSGSYPR